MNTVEITIRQNSEGKIADVMTRVRKGEWSSAFRQVGDSLILTVRLFESLPLDGETEADK